MNVSNAGFTLRKTLVSIQCVIDAELAFRISSMFDQSDMPPSPFRCLACQQPVRPLKASSGTIYFRHAERNPMCSGSYTEPSE